MHITVEINVDLESGHDWWSCHGKCICLLKVINWKDERTLEKMKETETRQIIGGVEIMIKAFIMKMQLNPNFGKN